jgi:trk system potassium uptake protein TrkH
VVDVGTEYTRLGQGVILFLIQVGGLGIMTFSVLALVLAGRRISLDQEKALRGTFTAVAGWRLPRLFGGIVLVTFLVEAAGFLTLWRAFGDPWPAAFHSVSAFCNAGFSLFADSLQRCGPAVIVPVLVLLILGGLGFTTIMELFRCVVPRSGARRRFTLHARLALLTTFSLWAAGAALLALAERGHVGDAVFMSASARTAGFDTTPVGALSRLSLFILSVLMFIGASPGSTGGGIKTTTFALAILAARATLRGQPTIVTHGREIPRDVITRMFAIILCSASVVLFGIVLIDVLEEGRGFGLLPLSFEIVSAFGTVGISTGITASLTTASQCLLCAVMFIGRVGSLSLFLFFGREAAASRVRYPEERILVG